MFAFYKHWVGGKSKEWNEIDDLKYLRETTGPVSVTKTTEDKRTWGFIIQLLVTKGRWQDMNVSFRKYAYHECREEWHT